MWAARLRQEGGAALARPTAADKKRERLMKSKRPLKAAAALTRGDRVQDAPIAFVPALGTGGANKKAGASTSLEALAEVSASLGKLACPEVSDDGGVDACSGTLMSDAASCDVDSADPSSTAYVESAMTSSSRVEVWLKLADARKKVEDEHILRGCPIDETTARRWSEVLLAVPVRPHLGSAASAGDSQLGPVCGLKDQLNQGGSHSGWPPSAGGEMVKAAAEEEGMRKLFAAVGLHAAVCTARPVWEWH